MALQDVTDRMQQRKAAVEKSELIDVIQSTMSAYQQDVDDKNKKGQKQSKAALDNLQAMIDQGNVFNNDEKKKYNTLIQQSVRSNAKMSMGVGKSILGGVKSAAAMLPNKDMIVGAIASQNPMLALGINAIRGFASQTKQVDDISAKEHAERMKILDQEKAKLGAEKSDDDSSGMGGVASAISDQTGIMNDQTNLLDGIHSALSDANTNDQKQLMNAQRERLQDLESKREASRISPTSGADIGPTPQTDAAGGISVFGKIFEVFGKMKGLGTTILTSAMSFIATGGRFATRLGGLIGKVGNFGKLLGRVGGPIAIVTGVIMSVLDFFKGFNDAEEILGIETAMFTDKLAAGIGAVFGGIAGLFDMVLGWFGMDTDFAGKTQELVAGFFKNTFDVMKGIFDSMKDWVMSSVDSLLDNMPGGNWIRKKLGWDKKKIEPPPVIEKKVEPVKVMPPVIEKKVEPVKAAVRIPTKPIVPPVEVTKAVVKEAVRVAPKPPPKVENYTYAKPLTKAERRARADAMFDDEMDNAMVIRNINVGQKQMLAYKEANAQGGAGGNMIQSTNNNTNVNNVYKTEQITTRNGDSTWKYVDI